MHAKLSNRSDKHNLRCAHCDSTVGIIYTLQNKTHKSRLMNLYLFKFQTWLLHYKATSINIILPLNTVKSKIIEGIKVKFGCDYLKVYTFLHTKKHGI